MSSAVTIIKIEIMYFT